MATTDRAPERKHGAPGRGQAGPARNMPTKNRLWPRRLAWLLLIWLGSVGALGLAAWALRLLMQSIGMSPP